MIFVKSKDLKVGMRIAKPIYNKEGVLLYDRDSKLTAQGVTSVNNFGLIGLYILEPAEPAPPISEEEADFERFQTMYVFRLKEILDSIIDGKTPKNLNIMVETIIKEFGHIERRAPFVQNLRSPEDFHYKHSLNVAILCAMLCHRLGQNHTDTVNIVTAALLHDVGMLGLPKSIMEKAEADLTDADIEKLSNCQQSSYQLLQPTTNPFEIPQGALRILVQTCVGYYHPDHPIKRKIGWSYQARILQVSNAFDNLTAMSLQNEPMTEISALRHIQQFPEFYVPEVVEAIPDIIHILPTGCCVELSNGEKGMVIESNPYNFLAPIVLQFKNNQILNFGDLKVASKIQIVNIMKTMDNRIKIDNDTLKHFHSDKNLSGQLSKIKSQQGSAAAKKRPKLL